MSVPKATMAVTTTPVSCAVLLGIGNRFFMPGTVAELRPGVKQLLNKWLTRVPSLSAVLAEAEAARGQAIADFLRMFGIAGFHHQLQGGGFGGNAGHHPVMGDLQHIAAGIGD